MPIQIEPAAAAVGTAVSTAVATPAVSPSTSPRRNAGRDPASLERLSRRYGRRLQAVARRVFHRAGLAGVAYEAEDLVQEAWCRLYQHWGPRISLRGGEAGLYPYLVRTTRNLAIDRARAHRSQKRGGGLRRLEAPAGLSGDAGADGCGDLMAGGPSPEEVAMRRQWRRLFRQRCRPYTSRRRSRRDLAVVELALVDGWSSRQIAAALRDPMSPSAIDTLIHRVRRGLTREGLDLPPRR